MKDHFDSLLKQFPLSVDKIFDNIDLDYFDTYPQLDSVLHSWNSLSVAGYHDLVSFIKRHMTKFNIPYQTALGLWLVYNLNFTEDKPTEEDIRKIAPLLGSYALSAAYQTRFVDFSNLLKRR